MKMSASSRRRSRRRRGSARRHARSASSGGCRRPCMRRMRRTGPRPGLPEVLSRVARRATRTKPRPADACIDCTRLPHLPSTATAVGSTAAKLYPAVGGGAGRTTRSCYISLARPKPRSIAEAAVARTGTGASPTQASANGRRGPHRRRARTAAPIGYRFRVRPDRVITRSLMPWP